MDYLNETMTLSAGVKLGRYEIGSKIGEGGMGEMFRARDTLGRDVAIKVIPMSVAVDMDRLRRFEQEACAAGALNHPNILVHDIAAHSTREGNHPSRRDLKPDNNFITDDTRE